MMLWQTIQSILETGDLRTFDTSQKLYVKTDKTTRQIQTQHGSCAGQYDARPTHPYPHAGPTLHKYALITHLNHELQHQH